MIFLFIGTPLIFHFCRSPGMLKLDQVFVKGKNIFFEFTGLLVWLALMVSTHKSSIQTDHRSPRYKPKCGVWVPRKPNRHIFGNISSQDGLIGLSIFVLEPGALAVFWHASIAMSSKIWFLPYKGARSNFSVPGEGQKCQISVAPIK